MTFDPWRGFTEPKLSDEWFNKLTQTARVARSQIIVMTTIAGSGHPGGSMSSLEMYLLMYHMAKVDPKNARRDDRDRIIVSHGHCSPGAYAALASAGFFASGPLLHGFRQAGSPFEGHVERSVPGVEWDTGNLGQGLSVGIGKAMYAKLSGHDFHTYVMMGDGEQQKGQISEARRVALKFGLTKLTALIDYNRLQISGKIGDIQPQNIRAEWEAGGWKVIEVDGHDLRELYSVLHQARMNSGAPICILAHTVMGKGVSFMENDENFHGAALSIDKAKEAFKELGGETYDLDLLMQKRKEGPPPLFYEDHAQPIEVNPGDPINYSPTDKSDNRGAWGKALVSVADANMSRPGFVMGVFDCDLAKSVKTDGFAKKYPQNFFQCGITEHNTATAAGSFSAEKALAVWADFGVFGIDETYNQARLNDINDANLKLFCTHSGVNVGEDGKTHQCIDYLALLNSTFGWHVITPADPNQTDKITRYVLSHPGRYAVIMGRSVVPTILDDSGKPLFGENYTYRYGRMEWVRRGEHLALVAAGNMLVNAVSAWEALTKDGINVSLVCASDLNSFEDEDLARLGKYRHVVTVEDHNVKTGFGTLLGSAMFERGIMTKFHKLGVERYGSSGKPDDLYKLLGLDATSIANRIRAILQTETVKR